MLYGRWAAKHPTGGLLIGDNAYVFGELLDDSERGEAMRQFHEEAAEHLIRLAFPLQRACSSGFGSSL